MAEESIFRFISVRSAGFKDKASQTKRNVRPFTDEGKVSEIYQSMNKIARAGSSREALLRLAKQFQGSGGYVRLLSSLDFKLAELQDWLAGISLKPIKTLDVEKMVKNLYGQKLPDLVNSAQFSKVYMALADTILIDALLHSPDGHSGDEAVVALKLLYFLKLAVKDPDLLSSEETLGGFIAGLTVILPDFLNLKPEGGKGDKPQPAPSPAPTPSPSDKLRARLTELEAAHRELSGLATNAAAFTPPAEGGLADRMTALEQRISEVSLMQRVNLAADTAAERMAAISSGAPRQMLALDRMVLTKQAAEGLSRASQVSLKELNIDLAQVNPIAAVSRIEREMDEVGAQLASTQHPTELLMIGGVSLEMNAFKNSLGMMAGTPGLTLAGVMDHCHFMSGIGDLLMVKQKLKAYELAEFAHVENVLAGESKERDHRRLDRREEVTSVETETDTEKERDLQSTERNELQTEAQKTVKSQMELDAGLQVSGSYGPTISFTASLNASYSSSSEESQRKSARFSKEVTEKTAERIRERVKTTRTVTIFQEIEEINKHSVVNTASNGHIRGIYRWLNKIYDAQVFNYGQRMMYEFVIPEPAAYFLYAMVENPPKDNTLIKPEPPKYMGQPLKPANLSRTNYQDYVSLYGVTSVPEPPPQFVVTSYFDKQEGNDTASFARSAKITVPPGYQAVGATVASDYIFKTNKSPSYRLMTGSTNYDRTGVWGSYYANFPTTYQGELAVAYELMDVVCFTLGVDYFCQLSSEGFTKWQQAVYASIMEGYQRQKSDYDDKVAAAQIQQGIQVLGQNPLINNRTVRDELKKLIVMMLTGSPFILMNGYYSTAEPFLNIQKACEDGSKIRFFENAFEWNNIMWVLYPYFWGRKARWITTMHLTDPDPDFAAFLKAGAARVQVPVRPGFERAVAHFCQFGEIWDGNDIPLRNDDLYVPIVDEITANLGKLDDGVPYPEGSQPWEVTVPTDLVVVQNLEEISGIRDILTGNNIKLTNP